MTVREQVAAAGARVRSKRGSVLMTILSVLLPWRAWFMRAAWTTLGRTIYAPTWIDVAGSLEPYRSILEHELVHVRQWRRWWLVYPISYLLLPLPIGLAWWRWRWEREAYLVQLRAGTSVEHVVDTLWRHYGWPWPRWAMRRWFRRALARGPS
ncbi:MAG: hypothetical protein IT379_39895 [Deltaproteobacteria bacterium]|nr:hypothetical protein [Deltaproteobacteria bacterium]